MKAVIWTKYGPPDVLVPGEVEKPVPKENEVLVKVFATAATMGDCEMRTLKFPYWIRWPMRLFIGVRKPTRVTIPGNYLAGEIEAVGESVTQFKVGDQVFGMNGMGFATYAEHICTPESAPIAIKPTNMSYEEAAAVPLGGLEALHFLGSAALQPGEKVLINGAGGSIGTFGIQLAKHYGAEVTAVDSADKLDMLRAVGADHVIDYTQEDFTQNGQRYDVIFDVVGKSSFSGSLNALNENGRYLIANPTGLIQFLRGKWASWRSSKQVLFTMTNPQRDDLNFLTEMVEAGKLKAVIDKTFPLEEAAEAHRYVESGQKKGNVILVVRESA